MKTNSMRKLTKTRKSKAPVAPVQPLIPVYVTDPPISVRMFNLESRVMNIEKQIIALQLVIREHAGYTDAIDNDVEDLLDDAFGGETNS